MIRNVIFDWSGTLVDDLPAVLDATNHVLGRSGHSPLSRDQFRAEFRLPFTGFYQRYAAHIPAQQLEQWFHARFREVQDSVIELPHARDFLEFCRSHKMRTLLVSAMHPDHFITQTKVNRFHDYLDHVYLGVWDKRAKIEEILQRHGLRPEETLFVGDMEHDIEAARQGGVHCVAVLTGYTGSEALRAAGPDLVVEHLGELRALLTANHLEWNPGDRALAANRRAPVITVGAAVFDSNDRVLMIRTRKWSDRWGIPGGKVKYGEPVEEALRRELMEETGLEISDIQFVLVQDCIDSEEFYRKEHFVLLNYRCRVSGPVEVRLNDEAQEFSWVDLQEALAMDLNRPTRTLLEALTARTSIRPAA